MKPIGITKKGFRDFIDVRAFKNSNDRHSSSGDRAARKLLKRIARALKRSDRNATTKRFKEEMNE